ncbi:hypothetical protein H7849_08295 [Alloacidobacterium dinghuense]|uniref:Uncharacterized protein n=1 Tax=Alloacidobacterium dinghuense TaxID=2763107 RepID=A0A7G8BMX3_9BACT|nr:hypothetical protein [Alloacidobacterium dinghuense]QNI33893.1 hypothetical protein H7849_08295 [Alloacidobacterium dinghuense]
MRRLKFAAALVALCTMLSVTRSLRSLPQAGWREWSGQVDGAALLPPTGPIPKSYKSYSLFLICNPQWLAPEKSGGLYDLYLNFQAFGRTIGDDQLAVWFLKSWSHSFDPALANEIDVERSVRFCKAWGLKPSAGPHIVVTTTYPDESKLSDGLPKNSAVFELGNMSPNQISDLITKLTDELVQKGHVENSATPSPPPPSMWVQLLESTQQLINNFGCAWSFKIDAGPVKTDLHSCHYQKT